MTKIIKTPIGRLVFHNPALLNERKKTINEQYGKMAQKMDYNNNYPPLPDVAHMPFYDPSAVNSITEAGRIVLRELMNQLTNENIHPDHNQTRELHAFINAASEKAASCAENAMQWRNMISPASSPDRNQARTLIAAAFQRDAAQYYKLAIDLRCSL